MKRSDFNKMVKLDKNSLIGKTITLPGANIDNDSYIPIKVKSVVFAFNWAAVIINNLYICNMKEYSDLCKGIDITNII